METPRWIPSKSANPLGFEVTPSQSDGVFSLSAGVESGRRGPDGSTESCQGRGALQTPNAPKSAAAKAVVSKKIRWPQGHAGSTPARGTRSETRRSGFSVYCVLHEFSELTD